MPLDTFHLSKKERDDLVKLKRWTKVPHWNVLCRLAFCYSLADTSPVRPQAVHGDSPVEMSWKTFGGEYQGVYLALLKQRCLADGEPLDSDTLARQFRLHLMRGVGSLANLRIRSLAGLASKFVPESRT